MSCSINSKFGFSNSFSIFFFVPNERPQTMFSQDPRGSHDPSAGPRNSLHADPPVSAGVHRPIQYIHTSPFAQQVFDRTPVDVENENRRLRWTNQSAPRVYGVPLASQKYLMGIQQTDVLPPDPGLVPVNPGPRRRDLDRMRPKLSAWTSKSYLHKK